MSRRETKAGVFWWLTIGLVDQVAEKDFGLS